MKQKYQVVRWPYKDWDLDRWMAIEMQNRFGLHGFTLEHIIQKWTAHSKELFAGWIIPDKDTIEDVFEVKLEKIDENTKEKHWERKAFSEPDEA